MKWHCGHRTFMNELTRVWGFLRWCDASNGKSAQLCSASLETQLGRVKGMAQLFVQPWSPGCWKEDGSYHDGDALTARSAIAIYIYICFSKISMYIIIWSYHIISYIYIYSSFSQSVGRVTVGPVFKFSASSAMLKRCKYIIRYSNVLNPFIQTHTHMYTCMHVCMCVCILCMLYIYIHIIIHTSIVKLIYVSGCVYLVKWRVE